MIPEDAGRELTKAERDVRQARVEGARVNVNVFMEYVYRDEATKRPIVQADMHRAWHRLADTHSRLEIWAHRYAAKTAQLTIGRTLWKLGRNPNRRFCVLSNTSDQASKIVRTMARYIETSPELHEVFPRLRRSARKADTWHSTALTVERPNILKEPSVSAYGVHGNITGARFDDLVIDDVLDPENTATQGLRDKLWDWYHATLPGCLEDDASILCVGTAYDPDDFMHRLAKLKARWAAYRYPVFEDDGVTPRWSEQWPRDRIERMRQDLAGTLFEYQRQMLCVPRDNSSSRIKAEWVQPAIEAGRSKSLAYALRQVPAGYRTYTGVDLAVSAKAAADLTAFTTIIVHPDNRREVLDVDSARIAGPEILSRIADIHRRYQSIIWVESNGAQEYITQFAGMRGIPVHSFVTGANKVDPAFGIEGLVAEMAGGRWVIPNQGGFAPEVSALISEILHYDPREHAGDRLMSLWIAREAARLGEIPPPAAEVGRSNIMAR